MLFSSHLLASWKCIRHHVLGTVSGETTVATIIDACTIMIDVFIEPSLGTLFDAVAELRRAWDSTNGSFAVNGVILL